MFWIAPYRIKRDIVLQMNGNPRLNKTQFAHLISKVRQKMLEDARVVIQANRLSNPDLYLWDNRDANGDFLMGFFIGSALDLTVEQRKERFNVFEKIQVNTSEKTWLQRLKHKIHKLTTGEDPDPRTLNPYVK